MSNRSYVIAQAFIHSWRISLQTLVNSVSNKHHRQTHTRHRVQQTHRTSLDQGANWFGALATNARRVSEANRIFNRTNPPFVANTQGYNLRPSAPQHATTCNRALDTQALLTIVNPFVSQEQTDPLSRTNLRHTTARPKKLSKNTHPTPPSHFLTAGIMKRKSMTHMVYPTIGTSKATQMIWTRLSTVHIAEKK